MSKVVCFKLLNGWELIGKEVSAVNHSSFVGSGEGIIFLDDAMFVGIQKTDNGDRLSLSPITNIGAFTDPNKPHLPFALYPNAILGQFPLEPEVDKMYREATSGIALIR